MVLYKVAILPKLKHILVQNGSTSTNGKLQRPQRIAKSHSFTTSHQSPTVCASVTFRLFDQVYQIFAFYIQSMARCRNHKSRSPKKKHNLCHYPLLFLIPKKRLFNYFGNHLLTVGTHLSSTRNRIHPSNSVLF